MKKKPYSKQEWRELRRLSREAHELELNQKLGELYREFHRWNQGELLAGELTAAIHKFYTGPDRKLFKLYNETDVAYLVARGLALGLLSEEDVPQPLFQKVEPLGKMFRASPWQEDE